MEERIFIEKGRGKFYESKLAPATFIAVHPSSIYHHPEREQQNEEYRQFVNEMRLVKRKLVELETKKKK